MITRLVMIERPSASEAEKYVNKALQEYEADGFDSQILNLTAQNINGNIPWRFVLVFTKNVPPGPPTDET